jgi:hypothetical protein
MKSLIYFCIKYEYKVYLDVRIKPREHSSGACVYHIPPVKSLSCSSSDCEVYGLDGWGSIQDREKEFSVSYPHKF